MKALLAAKENKPVPDSANRAFVKKDDEDTVEDSMSYFNRMLTAFGGTYREDSFQDVILRLASFFGRIAFTVASQWEYDVGSDVSGRVDLSLRAGAQDGESDPRGDAALQPDDAGHRAPLQRPEQLHRLLSQELPAVARSPLLLSRMKLRSSQETASDASASSSAPSASSSTSPAASGEGASRGVAQHGFSNRYVGEKGGVEGRKSRRRWARGRIRWCTRRWTSRRISGTR